MMQDLAMHLLDLTQNSIVAKASLINIQIKYSNRENQIILMIQDNGVGMDETQLKQATNPFYTTRTTRKVGLGLAFIQELAQMCNGHFEITSTKGVGTCLTVCLQKDHWDVPPLGDIGEYLMMCIQANGDIDYLLDYQEDEYQFKLDTREIKKELGQVRIDEITILNWLKEYINENVPEGGYDK